MRTCLHFALTLIGLSLPPLKTHWPIMQKVRRHSNELRPKRMEFQVLLHYRNLLFHLSLTVLFHYRWENLPSGFEGGSPLFQQDKRTLLYSQSGFFSRSTGLWPSMDFDVEKIPYAYTAFAHHYLRYLGWFLERVLRCFSSPWVYCRLLTWFPIVGCLRSPHNAYSNLSLFRLPKVFSQGIPSML